MKIKITVTTDDGVEQLVERTLDFKGSTSLISDLEREVGYLKQDINTIVSQATLIEQQALYSLEKKL